MIFQLQSGTNIHSLSSGKVIHLGFNGANGYTISIETKNIIVSYSHISPNFIININDTVYQNQIIAKVGPKYIENIEKNPYHDLNGKQTNGSTTGPHLHLNIKIDGKAIDPISIFN